MHEPPGRGTGARRPPLVRAAEQCAVEKHLAHPPVVEVATAAPELVLA